jgi:hypothetical protein
MASTKAKSNGNRAKRKSAPRSRKSSKNQLPRFPAISFAARHWAGRILEADMGAKAELYSRLPAKPGSIGVNLADHIDPMRLYAMRLARWLAEVAARDELTATDVQILEEMQAAHDFERERTGSEREHKIRGSAMVELHAEKWLEASAEEREQHLIALMFDLASLSPAWLTLSPAHARACLERYKKPGPRKGTIDGGDGLLAALAEGAPSKPLGNSAKAHEVANARSSKKRQRRR